MKKILITAILVAVPTIAFADSIGSFGWGTKLFDRQSGVVPQVLAVTTNDTAGNQTSGITTGTSRCTQDGAVKSNWKTAMLIDGNKERLAYCELICETFAGFPMCFEVCY